MADISFEELARELILTKAQIDPLLADFEVQKERLRIYAQGTSMEIKVADLGVVSVSPPRPASEKTIMVLDEEKLMKIPELRAKLKEHEILKEEIKKTSAAKAAVSIKGK